MTKTIDTGVFIPVGNHGWIHSVNSPAIEDGSFKRVLKVTKGAEALGFDFVLSPAIWRGRKGPSRHWMDSLESLITTSALLQATDRIAVYATVHMTVYHPSIVAKMVMTLDQIGPGRIGLNLVTGSSYLDLAHIGLWRDGLSHNERYDLGDEWISVLKRLCTEQVIVHKGKFFELNEATMGPKPSQLPSLVNAGSSSRGFQFAAENCDIALINAGADPKFVQAGKQAKATARAMSKPHLKVLGLVTVIPGDSDEDAQARLNHFEEGVDLICLEDIARGYSMNPDVKEVSSQFFSGQKHSSVSPGRIVGSYETVAKGLAKMIIESELDGVMLVVPDYVKDLEAVAKNSLARMPDYGVCCRRSQFNLPTTDK